MQPTLVANLLLLWNVLQTINRVNKSHGFRRGHPIGLPLSCCALQEIWSLEAVFPSAAGTLLAVKSPSQQFGCSKHAMSFSAHEVKMQVLIEALDRIPNQRDGLEVR